MEIASHCTFATSEHNHYAFRKTGPELDSLHIMYVVRVINF